MNKEEEIKQTLEFYNITYDPQLLSHYLDICNLCNLSAKSLANHLASYLSNNNLEKPTADSLSKLKDKLIKQRKTKHVAQRKPLTSHQPKVIYNKENISNLLNAFSNKPSKKRKREEKVESIVEEEPKLVVKTTSPPKPIIVEQKKAVEYAKRSNSGNVDLAFNEDLKWDEQEIEKTDCIIEQIGGLLPTKRFTYMYDQLEHKAQVLRSRLVSLGKKILKANNFENYSFLGEMSGTESIFLGRVLCESVSGEGKLNKNSVLLEGIGNEYVLKSTIVKLDLNNVDWFSLFPGQVIAVKGINSGDKALKVSECYMGTMPPLDVSDRDIVRPLNIFIAVGPFTTDENILYEPLDDLLNVVSKENPDLLLLIGPFVDSTNSLIESDKLDESYDDIFEHVVGRLKDISEKTSVVLIPSLRDIHHDFVFPQPAFDLEQVKNKKLYCFSNPAVFRVDGISIGVTAEDVLKKMSSSLAEQTKHNEAKPDRTKRLVEHFITQQSFYPFYIGTDKFPLDFKLSDKLTFDKAPSIMILPSDLQYFVKDVNGVLAINPRRLCQGSTGGTFAKVTILPKKSVQSMDENGSVVKRAKVEIVRI